MAKEKDYVIFRITEENSGGSMPDIKFPPSKTISAVQEVWDEETQGMRLMRYVPHEKSVWVDKQKTKFDWEDFRVGKGLRLQKPEFKDGYLIVNKKQRNLLEFMRKAKNNIENAEVNNVKGWTFFELDAQKESQNELDWVKRQTEINHQIFTMKEDDIKSIAVLMGINYQEVFNRTHQEVQLAVMNLALENPDKFEAVLANDMNKYKFEVIEALRLGILRKEGSLILKWSDGVRAATAQEGGDPIAVLAEKMLVDKELTDALRRRVRIEKGGYNNFKSQEEIIESSFETLEGLDKTDIIDKIVDLNKNKAGLLDKSGAWFLLDDEKLLLDDSEKRGYDAAKEYLLEVNDAYERAKAKLILYLNNG